MLYARKNAVKVSLWDLCMTCCLSYVLSHSLADLCDDLCDDPGPVLALMWLLL